MSFLGCPLALGSIFATVRGLIHDPQHRPIAGAGVTLKSVSTQWTKTVISDDQGGFEFDAVPVGEYTVSVRSAGFQDEEQAVVLRSGQVANLHFPMSLAKVSQNVEVRESSNEVDTTSSTAITEIDREQILHTPGAERTNSLAMITDFVPGAYMVHDQLHVRGGHQFTWMLDGIPVPNTNIATNVGPQFDRKNIDTLEVQRGVLSA